MSKFLFHLALSGLLLGASACRLAPEAPGPQTVRVLQFNVWQEGTSVPGGLPKIAAVVLASKAEVVAFSEVRNYQGRDWTAKVLAELKRQAPGQTFYGRFAGGDVGLVSRYPILSAARVFDETRRDDGSITAWTLELPGKKALTVASAHLAYRHYALYWVRGYHGGEQGWGERKRRPDGSRDCVTDPKALLAFNNESRRDEAVAAFIAFAGAQKEKAPAVPIVLCGDFNEGSHLDWTGRAKGLFDHHGVVLPWDNSLALKAAGFTDAYRAVHPDEVAYPGVTWPAVATDKGTTAWTQADERDRLDFIYTGPGLKPVGAWMVGPNACHVNGKQVANPGRDEFIGDTLPWPSDHKAVLAEVEVGE